MPSLNLPTTLCARQPIFDRGLEVYGYELLYTSHESEKEPSDNHYAATSEMMLNAFTELPFEQVLGGKKGLVNFPRGLLKEASPICENEIIIELSECIFYDESLTSDLENLKKSGLSVAVGEKLLRAEGCKLLSVADFVVIDANTEDIEKTIEALQKTNDCHAKFFAKNIDSEKELIFFQSIGIELFQGNFLSKPAAVEGKKIGDDQQAALRLLQVLQNQQSDFDDIERVVSSSACLTFKLLRLVNSSAFSLARKVDSVQQALTILGLDKVRSWGMLLVLSDIPSKPKVLSSNALIRAYMCQSLGRHLSLNDYQDVLFTMGLISTLDVFLDLSLEVIVESLDLTDWVKKTLLYREGSMGLILNTAIFYEKAEFSNVNFDRLNQLDVSASDIQTCYQDSILRTAEIMNSLR